MSREMTVAQLTSYLKGVFDDEELLHEVRLTGEVTDISYSDKHTFLVLSDGGFSVQCVRFNSRDRIEKGVRVTLSGSVNFYEKRGSVSFAYNDFAIFGQGEKNAKLCELKNKLFKLGYFENRPKLPKYITSVVVVTSPDGAAIRDFIRVVGDKCPFVKVRVYPVKVQGEGAASQMAKAINGLQKSKTDAIVLCRGGGSDDDLDSFNDEALSIAVAKSEIPVISAVGHEIDYTLCDFCAGTRAGTPSIAGEIVNAHALALVNDIIDAICSGYNALNSKLVERKNRLDATVSKVYGAVSKCTEVKKRELVFSTHRAYGALDAKMRRLRMTAKDTEADLLRAADGLVASKRLRVEKINAVLNALDPTRIIKAGYAAVEKDGKSVIGAAMLDVDDDIRLIFADGVARATVKEISRKN